MTMNGKTKTGGVLLNKKGMESIKELYKVGRGPSSSHTIGPERACRTFMEKNPDADSFKAILFGSLAKTGEGHGTGVVIKKTFLPFECANSTPSITSSIVNFDCALNDIAGVPQ